MSLRTSRSLGFTLLLSANVFGFNVGVSVALAEPESMKSPVNQQEVNSNKKARPERPPNASPFSTDTEIWARGRILVKAADGVSDDEMFKQLQPHGGKPVDRIDGIDVHVVELPDNMNEKAIANLLAHNPKFKFAEVDSIGTPTMTANDSYYGSSWHLPKIQAPAAWDMTLGDGVTIAIVDTGVDHTHPDLAGKIVPGYNFYDKNTNAADVQGHGTGVAGTAAALSNNAIGVTGVAWNAKIMPLRISDSTGSAYASAAAAAITWAADHGARVANLSYQNFNGSSTIWSAASYMQSKNGVTVICMGNSGGLHSASNSQPAIYVGATDSADAKASFSTYGPSIDLSAPGTSIYSTKRGGGYGAWAGTSFSTPIVAGVAALAMSANPALTGQQIQKILFDTSDDRGAAGWDQYFGWGRVNAARAVAAAKGSGTTADTQAPTTAITSPTSGAKVKGTVTVNMTAADNKGISKVVLYVGGVLHSTDTTSPYSLSWNTTGRADGSVTLQAKAYDTSGNIGSSNVVTVTVDNIADTPPPASCTFNGQTVASGSNVTAFLASSVPSGSTCTSQVRTCTNGVLSGTYQYPSCTLQTTTALAVTSLQATNDATNMMYKLGFTGTPSRFQLFLDTDRNSSTGYSANGLGADYLIENGALYKYSGTTGGWSWTYVKTFTLTKTTNTASWTIERTRLGSPTSVQLVARIWGSGGYVSSNVVTQTVTN